MSDEKWVVDPVLADEPATRGDLFRIANRSLILAGRMFEGMVALRDKEEDAIDASFSEIMGLLQDHARQVDELVGSYEVNE